MAATGYVSASGDTRKVNKAGDVLTGDLVLVDNTPDTDLSAVSRAFVEAAVAEGGGGPSPSGTVTPATSYGQAPAAGASGLYARGDHTHGTPAAPAVGTTSGTYAAGDDARITGAAQKSQNLADLANPATARTNLGLGTAAVQNVGAFDASGAAATALGAAISDAAAKYRALQPWVFDVTAAAYGAVGDAKVIADGAITTGTAVLTSPSNGFATAAPGMYVSVKGAGPTGITTHIAQIASKQNNGQVTLNANAATTVSGAIVIFGTDDTAAVQAAVDAAESYLSSHTYAQVYFPPRPYIVAGALNTSKSGNGQIVFGVYPTTGNKKILEFVGEGDGAAAVRHWEQLVPQHAGSCLISFGVYASIPAQSNDISSNGNPGVISGPNEGASNGLAYGAAARFSNIIPGLKNLAILNTHSSFGLTYGAFNFFGCANARLENVGGSTAGVVPGSDYTSPGQFANGLSIGGLLPAPGNNDLVIAKNVSIGGGYTYGIFATEHLVCDRIMVLYCWSAICAVGTYAGSVGSVHAMLFESASVEACINEVYIVGAGSGGVGPIVDILQLSTESSTPNIAGNSQLAVNSALGTIRLTGLFSETGVTTQYPTGIEIINGQVPAAIKRKTSTFTCSPIDRDLVCDTTAGSFTGTLPAADFCPVEYTFKNVGTNTLTVAAAGGQLIYTGSSTGTTTVALTLGQTLTVKALYNGSSWGWYATAFDRSPDVQVFTASGTWTKPAGASTVLVHLVGGGGGGGSGRRGAAGTVRCGGGAGAGAPGFHATLQASALPSSVAVTVGTGGAGAAARTTDDTDGAAGSSGGATSFGTYARVGTSGGGAGGTATTGTGGSNGVGTVTGVTGAAASTSGGTGTNGSPGVLAGAAGGAGGGISSGNTAGNGGAGGSNATNSGGSAGVAGGSSPTAGTDVAANSGLAGAGGGGGAGSTIGVGQSGANGGLYGGGGGGGGASVNGSNSGAGGNGGSGIAIITTYF